MPIYFVDEDRGPMRKYRNALQLLGYEVIPIEFAEKAFLTLSSLPAKQIDLVIIDIMLAVYEPDSVFSAQTTGNWAETGFVLLDLLMDKRPDVFPQRALIFSAIYAEALILKALAISERHEMPFLRKREYQTPALFAIRVQRRLEELDGARA